VERDVTYEEFFYESDFVEVSLERLLQNIPDDLKQSYIDLSSYMNLSAMTVDKRWNLTQSYVLFRTMGLRHLTVVNAKNQVVGILTRKDFL